MGKTLTISEAMRAFEQGKSDRRKEVTECPYKADTSEFPWWSKGWLEEHTALEGGED